jgi:hypothetical protein
MATIDVLANRDAVIRISVGLEPADQILRNLYGSPSFIEWLDNGLPALTSRKRRRDLEPDEQIDTLFRTFITGGRLYHPENLACLIPQSHGIWEMRTPDVRIFGWFVVKDSFVAVSGGDATEIKKNKLYNSHIKDALRFRRTLDLTEPKFITGTIHDVIST